MLFVIAQLHSNTAVLLLIKHTPVTTYWIFIQLNYSYSCIQCDCSCFIYITVQKVGLSKIFSFKNALNW